MVLDFPLAVVGTSTWDSVINIFTVDELQFDECCGWCQVGMEEADEVVWG